MGITLGLDLGVKTGALARIKVNEEYNLIEKQEILFSWTKGPKVKSSLEHDILRFFNQNLTSWIQFDFGQILAIDWDISEVYWSANKRNTNTITFLAGYITALAHKRGIHVIFISPKEVRAFLGFNGKTHKNEVQRNFLNMPRIFTGKYRHNIPPNNHELDAIILAYVADLKNRAQSFNRRLYG